MASPSKRLVKLYDRSPLVVQDVLSSAFGVWKWLDERGPAFRRIFRQLHKSQWWSHEQLGDLQIRRLRDMLRFAQEHVPFYRKRFAEYGVSWDQVQSVEDLKRFPILTKEDVRKNRFELLADVKPKSELIRQSTSGTTGSPLEVLMTRQTYLTEKAWIQRHRTWGGYDNRFWRATFGGYKVVPIEQDKPPFWRFNYPWKQIHFSTFHMSENNLRHYVEALRSNNIRFLDGYPSTLHIMARYLVSVGQTIPMRAVFTGAEPLYDLQRETIESAFSCKVFDYYGLTEKVISAGECDHHSGLHVSMEHVVVEILSPQDGRVGENGAVGELVGTSLVNTAMPLIRYRTGDIAYPSPQRCSCGRGLEMIGPVKTKVEDIVICADGRHISASNLTYPFKPIHSIDESQIVQESLTDVVVRIVRGPDYTDDDEKRLLDGLRERLGPATRIRAEYVDEIERTSTGKFRFVVSNVSSNLIRQSQENQTG